MNRNQFIKILCLLEGFKVSIKNLHWHLSDAANKHKTLDEVYDFINTFEDGFAEDGITIFGDIEINEIHAIQVDYDENNLIDIIGKFAKTCKKHVLNGDEVEFAGLNSVCDEFIHNINVSKYRYGMD